MTNGIPGNVYNIGGSNHRTNIEVAKDILRILKKSGDLITFVEDRKGHDVRYAVDNAKIRNTLGWDIRTEFEDGLQNTIDWYRDNAKWVESVKSEEYRKYYKLQYNLS